MRTSVEFLLKTRGVCFIESQIWSKRRVYKLTIKRDTLGKLNRVIFPKTACSVLIKVT